MRSPPVAASPPRLRARLLLWLLVTIVVAAGGSALVVVVTRPDVSESPRPLVARAMARRLARIWDDPPACDAYVREVSEATGLELRLRRDVASLPPAVRRSVRPLGQITFATGQGAFIPVVWRGEVVGAVQFPGEPSSPGWLRVVASLAAAVLVLAIAADRVARRLARPLEGVAEAADRFGAGDLSARASLDPTRAETAEAEHLARAFNGMAERVERTVRDQRELLAAVSHELRSPLGRAEVALAIARERAAPESKVAIPLDDVARQITELDTILGDLLAVARVGLTDLRTEPLELLPWLRARLAKEQPPVELDVSEAAGGVDLRVQADPALLGRVLDNLLRNARVHGHPADVPLEVRVAVEGDAVRIDVCDRGPGFSTELLSRAFEPFVRGDRSRAHGAGAGVGLALVKRIAEAHGGRAHAANRAPDSAERAGSPSSTSSTGAAPLGGAVVGVDLPILRGFGTPRQPS